MPDVQLAIDLSDDTQFKVYVVQQLTQINEKLSDMPQIRETVEKHEKVYLFGKWLGVPVVGAVNLGFSHLLKKLGF